MRIAIAQINPTLGDFSENAKKIIYNILAAHKKRAELVVFPECALFGYHPYDLLEQKEFVLRQEKQLAKIQKVLPEGIGAIFGLLTIRKSIKGRPFYNSAVLLEKNKKPKFFHKQLLPTGDVFDEARFIEPGKTENNIFNWKGHRFLLTICEDIWAWPDKQNKSSYVENPLLKIKRDKKFDLVINLSASPYFWGKEKLRHHVTQATAKQFKCPVLYANLVGGQDEIIFDGSSFVIDQNSKIIMSCQKFAEDLNVFDLKTHESWTPASKSDEWDDMRRALVLGIRDFCRKTSIDKIHFGLSGGIDSALIACLAVDALGAGKVCAIGLPGPFSDPRSSQVSAALAQNLRIEFKDVDIQKTYHKISGEIAEKFGIGGFSTVHENLQARIRALFLMSYANAENSMLLTTGNKSEYATGYCTLYGDMCGGLAPLADLTKAQVYKLAKLYNKDYELIPKFILDRPPTAELRPNQSDQDSLPPYSKLDKSVVSLVEKSNSIRTSTDKWLFAKLLKTEFKRWQAPPILKVSQHSFGRGRRFPISGKFT